MSGDLTVEQRLDRIERCVYELGVRSAIYSGTRGFATGFPAVYSLMCELQGEEAHPNFPLFLPGRSS